MTSPGDTFPKTPKPSLFPKMFGAELLVATGSYELLGGTDESIKLSDGHLEVHTEEAVPRPDPFPGVRFRGWYTYSNGDSADLVSFLYHKKDPAGQLEKDERCIVWEGTGYGVHSGHIGQAATWYLVGVQIGVINHETGELVMTEDRDVEIAPKHFSMACITNGPLGEAVLANPVS